VSSSWPCANGLCNSWIGRPVYKYELRDDVHLCAASSGQDALTRDCDGNPPQLWIETSNGHEVSVSRTDAARNEQNMCSLTNGLPLTVVSSTGCTTTDDEKWSFSSSDGSPVAIGPSGGGARTLRGPPAFCAESWMAFRQPYACKSAVHPAM
jgi:hypothetical protein